MSYRKFYLPTTIICLLLGLNAVSALAAEGDEKELGIHISGAPSGAKALTVTLEVGSFASQAVRVYSEPSHTLLLLAIDNGFESSREGVAWQNAVQEVAAAKLSVHLPGSQPRVTIPARPPKDDRIAVWVYGSWSVEEAEDRLLADALVGEGAFDFTTYLARNEEGALRATEHCCSSGGCGSMCRSCTGPKFSCCLLGPPESCCWVKCGWLPSCTC